MARACGPAAGRRSGTPMHWRGAIVRIQFNVAPVVGALTTIPTGTSLRTQQRDDLRIVLPSALPMMFTGLRLSLGIAWMVLIAAEMLAQNPGLGKFVWDEFQNGSSQSLGRIMVAVIVIGLIGFLLDRLMLMLQRALVWDKSSAQR